MPIALTLLAIVAVVVGVSALARRYSVSAPLVLTAVGILISFAPGVPEVTVGPEVIGVSCRPRLSPPREGVNWRFSGPQLT